MVKMMLRTLEWAIALIHRELQKLLNGLSGRDRRDKRRLMKRLSTMRAECNLMRRDMSEKQRLADLEIQDLATLKQTAETARDDLQVEVWELEQQVKELLGYIASTQDEQTNTLPDSEVPTTTVYCLEVDLSRINLGLVGGHPATRRGVIKVLSSQYGLQHWVEIPPLKEAKIRKSKLKRKLSRCSLIVIIADYMSHPLTHAVFGLQASGALTGEVVLLNCHGRTGVVREILNLVKRQNIEK